MPMPVNRVRSVKKGITRTKIRTRHGIYDPEFLYHFDPTFIIVNFKIVDMYINIIIKNYLLFSFMNRHCNF